MAVSPSASRWTAPPHDEAPKRQTISQAVTLKTTSHAAKQSATISSAATGQGSRPRSGCAPETLALVAGLLPFVEAWSPFIKIAPGPGTFACDTNAGRTILHFMHGACKRSGLTQPTPPGISDHCGPGWRMKSPAILEMAGYH